MPSASRSLRCFGREEEDSALEELSLEATGDSFSEKERKKDRKKEEEEAAQS